YSAFSRSSLARLGFTELSAAAATLEELSSLVEIDRATLIDGAVAADPDLAAEALLRVAWRDPSVLKELLRDTDSRAVVWRVFGASTGLADFFLRHPDELSVLAEVGALVPNTVTLQARM